jgi:glycosyltransferase involved in cell wall biosynthesis
MYMKVSIITVTYNSEDTLGDTIRSVLNQTYHNLEYWIIDGGSVDSTMDIVKRFEGTFEGRLHYISEKDHGIYDAMNKGVRMATGDVVGILNSDDFFTSDTVIERLVKEFDDDVEAVYGDVHFVKNDNLNKCVRYYSGKIFRPWMVKYGFIAPHPSFYIRKSTYQKYGLYSPYYKISADYELIARLCYKYQIKTKYINVDFVTMRMGGASTRNFHNRMLGLKEDIVACRQLDIKTNKYKISLKYLIKIFESIFIRR